MKSTILRVGCAILCCLAMPLYAAHIDFNSRYVLKLPRWGDILNTPMEVGEYDVSFTTYPVTLSPFESARFLMAPEKLQAGEIWRHWNGDGTTTPGWIGTLDAHGNVEISGMMIRQYFFGTFELTGTIQERGSVQGHGVFRFMEEHPNDPSPYVYTFEWALDRYDTGEPVMLSNTITYHGPPPPPVNIPTVSNEEAAQYPFTDDLGIKRFAEEDAHARERFYKGLPQETKQNFDVLLQEFTWDELPHIPGILLLIDHLAGVDTTYQQTVAEKYVRDRSIHFFGDMTYEALQHVPPLFATLYVLDKIPDEHVQSLQEASARFLTLVEAYRAIPTEELEDLPVLEFMITVSEQLPEEFRSAYYAQSPKLRAYVSASNDERLQELYPF